jgi:hypothetical protein
MAQVSKGLVGVLRRYVRGCKSVGALRPALNLALGAKIVFYEECQKERNGLVYLFLKTCRRVGLVRFLKAYIAKLRSVGLAQRPLYEVLTRIYGIKNKLA